MSKQLVELAIRSKKTSVDINEFLQMKNTAVKSLVSINGVGPEHEYDPIINTPTNQEKVYIGTTRYSSIWSFVRACFSIRFITNLIKFLKMCDLITGVFIKPEDENFDYVNFATKENVTEIAVLRPNGISKNNFFEERNIYLNNLNNEKEVVSTHAFETKFGFFNTDVIVHYTVYQNKVAYENMTRRASELDYVKTFNSKNKPLIISACKMLK